MSSVSTLWLLAISQREVFSLAQQSNRAKEVRLWAANLGRGVINLLNRLLKAPSPLWGWGVIIPVHLYHSTFQNSEAIGSSSSLSKRFILISLLLQSKEKYLISHLWLLFICCLRKRPHLCIRRETAGIHEGHVSLSDFQSWSVRWQRV